MICWMVLLVSGPVLAPNDGTSSTVKLSDPAATAETQALYRNLHKVAQEGVLFGHQDTLAYGVGRKGDPNKLDSDVYRLCGKFPAVFGWDIGHVGTPRNIDGVPFQNMKTWIRKGYEKGGISTVSWHAQIPATTQSAWTQQKVMSRLLLDVIKSSPATKKIAWVLVWRNADRRQNYAAFPESPTAENFKAFERDPVTLFLEDLPPMYK